MNFRQVMVCAAVLSAGSLLDAVCEPTAVANAACGNWCRERRDFFLCGTTSCYRVFLPTCGKCVGNNACVTTEAGSPWSCANEQNTFITEYTCSGGSCLCNGEVWVEAQANGTLFPDLASISRTCSGVPGTNAGDPAPPP